jgi:serine/threonine-protein kinase
MQAGQHIRDYVLDQKIGGGGMGEVWSAVHSVLQRPVAIKGMAVHLAADPQLRERFVQEARAQARLQHPRVLGVIDAFREDGVDYLVMPLVAGRSLADRLTEVRGPLPPAEALRIATDILEGLEAAHQRGIIHRDVKPSNILLDGEGHALLTDFGIALLVGQDRLTNTGISLGTPFYMSPEQIRDPKTIDQRSDVYSAACVIYEMLAGRPPFLGNERAGSTDFVLLEAHLQRDPKPIRTWNPAVPAALDDAVLRGLAKEPVGRYGGSEEFRRALTAATAAPEPLPPPPPPPVQRAVPPPIPPPRPMPVAPAVPPPFPQQPAAAPRSRSGFLLGIACGAILAVAALVVLGQKLAEKQAQDTPSEQTAPTTATPEPEATTAPETAPDATSPSGNFVKVWADHNVQREGRTGMLIHSHFVIQGARQATCQIAAYFYYANGDVLKDFDQDYRASDGQASVGEEFTPQYDSTEFEDYTLFMPYDELHMEAGNHDLKFDMQVHHQPSGKVAVQSPYVSFTLNQS